MADQPDEFITTIRAKCRDCYKCLRSCPVKAIKVEPGDLPHELHARVLPDRCILDGRCVLVCPQQAKKVSKDTDTVKSMLIRGDRVAVSLAPSFPAAFSGDPLKIPSALRRLGFHYVQETAIGAEMVAAEHQRLRAAVCRPLITSSCPAVVNLIQCHYPEAIPFLAPVVSPMIAHGRYLKQLLPDHRVVFIGPCIAKKHEMGVADLAGAVDAVLTFEELAAWLREAEIDLEALAPGGFDGISPNWARLFAVDGGTLRTAALSTDILSDEAQALSGLEKCIEVIQNVVRGSGDLPDLIELVSCEGGCVSGPMSTGSQDLFVRRQRVLRYAAERARATSERAEDGPKVDLTRRYINKKPNLPLPDEDTIHEILAKSGKFTVDDELNCGACGYSTCREKAIAVFQGLADPEMCIPYMRQRAESMSALIVSSTPNGIIVTSPDETIIDINPSAERMFRTTRQKAVGLKLGALIDPVHFRQVIKSRQLLHAEVAYPELELATRQTIFWEDGQQVAVGIFANCTEEKRQADRVNQLRNETLEKAQGVISKQMEVAQKIASLLGETTAETKVLLTKLMRVMRDEDGEPK